MLTMYLLQILIGSAFYYKYVADCLLFSGLIQNWGWGHAQYVWDVRSNPKVAEVFEEVFETKDLLVSFDAINCGLGALIPSNSSQIGIYNGQSNLHCDQRYTMNNFECVQSWITANPIDVGDGTLRVLQGKVVLLNNHINNHILRYYSYL